MIILIFLFHNKYGDIMHKSVWYEGVKIDKNKPLNKNITADIFIIGGGITGLSIAYHLKDSHYKICLVDQGTIGCSTTSKSTGKLTYMQDQIYNSIQKIYNEDIALKYLQSQVEAINIIKDIIDNNNIKCDLRSTKSIIFTSTKSSIKKLKQEKNLFIKGNVEVNESNIDIFNSKYSIEVSNTYCINPLKYVNNLKKIIKDKIDIYEDTRIIKTVKEKDYYISKTKDNIIKSKIVIYANHYPWFLKPSFIPLKTYKEKSTIVAYQIDETKDISGINIDKETISFRYYQDYFIYLNDTHKICDNDKMNIDTFKHKLGIPKIDYIWSNHDLITFDRMPLIGQIDDNMFLATGYNTWGLTNGSLAGKIISNIILNKENDYIALFNPKRALNISVLKNIISNMTYNIKAYVKPKRDNIYYEYEGNQKMAVCRDDNGIEHKVFTKCPHMKCGLIFNKNDNTWDCPCHGSRFDIDGNCVLGPSNEDIKVTFKKNNDK